MKIARYFAIILLSLSLFAGEDAKPEPKKKTVWVTLKEGIRYHRESCRTIKNRDKKELTVEVAKKQNFTPCKVCSPGE